MDTFPAAALPLLSAVVAAVLPLSVEAVAAGSLEEPHAVSPTIMADAINRDKTLFFINITLLLVSKGKSAMDLLLFDVLIITILTFSRNILFRLFAPKNRYHC
jgi:hypothetical protein